MARQWTLSTQKGFQESLEYNDNVPIPSPESLGPHDVLVRLHAASINYRELDIASQGLNGPLAKVPVVPGCDGAGTVEAIGSEVKDHKAGDRVITFIWDEADDNRFPSAFNAREMMGMGMDGTLRTHGVFSENTLITAPESLDWLQASTLTCTYISAYNALFGVEGHKAGPGKRVFVQGTGGVSIAALQLAKAAGAEVIATTSSDDKAAKLTALGASHIVNYRTSADWGQKARALTPNNIGFDIVIDIGGNETLPQSLAAIRVDGLVTVIGGVGSQDQPVPLFATLIHTCIVRGIISGSKAQYKELVRFIDEKKIVPVIDDEVFELAQAKDAYRKLDEKKHFAKVVMRID
ncbi:zinc-binding dehydrogenase domain-containing protein [Sarocladium implicatum]|nr:zinc-binding dehydrogenase domain-containing protein [Sarocladium implicatum]